MPYGLAVANEGGFRLGLLTGLCALALLPALGLSQAGAQDTAAPAAANTAQASTGVAQPNGAIKPSPQGRRYFIELRARSAMTYGHTFAIYGRLNANGRIASSKVVGLHPATESSVPWMIGHFVPVPSETGASDGDTEDQYVIARFRVALNEGEYKKLLAYIDRRQKNSPVWHAALYNCNAFIGDVARFMGYDVPVMIWQMPKEYINGIHDANINRRDLTGVLGVPVKVESADALRAAALRAIAAQEKRKRAPKPAAPKPTVAAQ
jgi:hypothetical protein